MTQNVQLLNFFPKPAPREKQVKSLTFVEEAVSRGFKHVVLAAPTGVGKSAIGIAVCSWAAQPEFTGLAGLAGGYYLTEQKLLQDQLRQDFIAAPHDVVSLKSAVEYSCEEAKNCGLGGLRKKGCPCKGMGTCPYSNERAAFMAAQRAVTNYAYFMTERLHRKVFAARRVLILDEAHSLERVIIRFVDLTITDEMVRKFAPELKRVPTFKLLGEFATWVGQAYLEAAQLHLETLLTMADGGHVQDELAKQVHELDMHIKKVVTALDHIENDPSQWVYWQELDGKKQLTAIARPLNAAPFAPILFEAADLKVYMSACPGDRKIFCRSLGLHQDEVAWASFGSPFKVENRKVVMCTVGSMSLRNVDLTMPACLRTLTKIFRKHAAEKGLLHVHSYKLGQAIVDHFSKDLVVGPRLIFPANAEEREAKFLQHTTSTMPTIMVSPSMTTGFDFIDDLARWQVIVKCPYPSLSDRQVAAKKDQDEEWYAMETIKTVIQASGRICRSETDHGITYVLDADFRRLYGDYEHLFPSWFTASLVWPDSLQPDDRRHPTTYA
jgi:Rad3-related DNA helicase